MNILITGANGQLGSELNIASKEYVAHCFFFENSSSLNITNKEALLHYFKENRIDAVINCAAYTQVDKAEQHPEKAKEVNTQGVLNVLEAVKVCNAKCIHISTDYVFDGNAHLPYKEEDQVRPLGVYGNSKRAGEELIINSDTESIVIRTSWLYSSFGNNFVKTMLRLGTERKNLNVVFDQIGSPTYAKYLAKACLSILCSEKQLDKTSKVYHYSNLGVASWFDFAKAIMEFSQTQCNVYPIASKDFPTLAKRPHYSVLNTQKIRTDFAVEIPYWREVLKECIEHLKSN